MRILHLCLLGLCLVLFTYFATTDLALPGPQDDEVVHAVLAIDLLRPKFPLSRDYSLHIGQQPFPFGINRHSGALKAYMLWPFFALFEPTVELLRLFTVLLGILVLIFFYLFALEHIGQWGAFFATLLLSLDSSFIFYSKLDVGPIVEELLWLVVCLWAFGRWGHTHRLPYLLGGLIGSLLGTYSHITFAWFILAYLVAALVCFPQEIAILFKRPFIYFMIPFALSDVGLFLYWFVGDQRKLLFELPGLSGIFIMFERLSTRGGILPDVLFGRFTKEILPLPGIHTRPLTDVFIIVSFLFVILCRGIRSKFLKFILIVAGVMLFEISLTPPGFGVFTYHRMMPFYIFLFFLGGVAVAQSSSFRHLKERSIGFRLVSLGIVLLAILSVWGQISFKREADREIRRTGGRGFWSDEIYRVAETLEKEKWERTVCFDWGYRRSLVFLTKGKIPIEGATFIHMDEATRGERFAQLIKEASPRTLFLIRIIQYPRRARIVTVPELQEAIRENGKAIKVEHIFYHREGTPMYLAQTIHDKKS